MRFGALRSRLTTLHEKAAAHTPLLLVSSAALASIVWISLTLLGPSGIRQLRSLRADSSRQESANTALKAQIEQLDRTARALGNPPDPRALEKAAREQLGYIRADEILFKFE